MKKNIHSALMLLATIGLICALSNCTVSLAPDGTPTFGADPVAAMNAYNAWTAKKGLPPVQVIEPEILPAK